MKPGRPRISIDHLDIDWSLNNLQLARLHGYSHVFWCIKRRQLGQPPSPRGRCKVTLPDDIDWELTDSALSRRYGGQASVWRSRRESRKIAPGIKGNLPRGGRPARDTASIDWSLNNPTLARQLGVSRQRVDQLRKRENAPASPGRIKTSKT